MSLCDKALAVLREHPADSLTAQEVGELAEGRPVGMTEVRRYDRACLSLVDHDLVWPRNVPRGPRSYRARTGVPAS